MAVTMRPIGLPYVLSSSQPLTGVSFLWRLPISPSANPFAANQAGLDSRFSGDRTIVSAGNETLLHARDRFTDQMF